MRGARVRRKRCLVCQHPVEEDAEREDVGSLVFRRAPPLFGRHVGRRPALHLPPAEGVRHPQIQHLHLSVLAQIDVPRGEIAVDDALGVRVGESFRRFHPDAERLAQRNGTLLEPLGQSAPAKQLEHEVGTALAAPDVEERDDVGMGEARRSLRLAEQPLLAHVLAVASSDRLEGDGPAELAVLRLVDDAEAAAPDLPHEFEAPHDHARPERTIPLRAEVLVGGVHQRLEQRGDLTRRDLGCLPDALQIPVRHGHPRSWRPWESNGRTDPA
jgi:hypothetical protein